MAHLVVPCNGEEIKAELTDEKSSRFQFVTTTLPCMFSGKMTIWMELKEAYEVPELCLDAPVVYESEPYLKMIQKSLLNLGNTYRLKQAIEKARRGEDVTIAVIGGSISEGAGAKPCSYKSYPYLTYEAFAKRFGKGENVHYVKAGLGGTPSELGLLRYEKDVLRDGAVEPDVLVVEFAVNDRGDETEGVCYESLILKAMEGPGHPAVVLMFAVFMDDWNLQDRLAKVGFHYDLAMVSVKDAVVEQFYWEHPICTKRQYFSDVFHPTNVGHQIMADCMDYLWQQVDATAISEFDVDLNQEPIIGNTYRNVHTITRENIENCDAVKAYNVGSFVECDPVTQGLMKDLEVSVVAEFPVNWMHVAGTEFQKFTMTITCDHLMMIYKDTDDVSFGEVEVYVDGSLTRQINPLEIGWNHVNAVIIYSGDRVEEKKVEIRFKEGEEQKKFSILGFGYTMNEKGK